MKKLLLIAILSVLMCSPAMAGTWYPGTIERVIVYGNGQVGVELNTNGTLRNIKIDDTHPYQKEMFAIALTAKSTAKGVQMFEEGGKWNGITLAE